MRLKIVFTYHKQIWSHVASKIIMVISSKPNFLISKVGKFSLGRNCLTHRLPLLLSFLNLPEYIDIKNPKASESLFPLPNYATLLSVSFHPFRSSLHYAGFPLVPTFCHYPSFLFPLHLTPPIVCLFNFLMLALAAKQAGKIWLHHLEAGCRLGVPYNLKFGWCRRKNLNY